MQTEHGGLPRPELVMSSGTHSKSSKAIQASNTKTSRPRRPNYNYIHRNVLPIEVHPLPVLIPHNPLSLVAIALSYIVQILSQPAQPVYKGYFSSSTSSIHITDPDTTRKLWEMGFFGRGSLSRSEPTWLENRKKRGVTAEENTAQRRIERRQQKLERARKEQHDLKLQMLKDSNVKERMNGHAHSHMNGHANGNILTTNAPGLSDIASVLEIPLSNGAAESEPVSNESIHGFDEWKQAIEANGIPTPPPTSVSSETSQPDVRPIKRLQRTKTVRFSPTIEAREFDLSSPIISPIKSPAASPLETAELRNEKEEEKEDDANQEHLNVSMEEAFFLSYGLGVLQVYCDDSETVLPPTSLLALFRRHSYHPPRSLSMPAEPDDPFMLSYAVYHHYRSLGWVVRSGVKFSVDYLLYNRGPAFSHAEFAITILPSFSHPYWSETVESRRMVEQKTKKTWWWLHSINRVQAQVHKQLVLCYVDVPPPLKNDEKGRDIDIGKLLSRYRVRDVNVRRWTPNRSRD